MSVTLGEKKVVSLQETYVLMVLMLRKLSERIVHFYLLSDTNATKKKKTWIKYTALKIN